MDEMRETKEMVAILQKAAASEIESEQYYQQAAKRAQNPLARSTFTALAREERHHAELLQAYCDVVAEQGQCPLCEAIGQQTGDLAQLAEEVLGRALELLGDDEPPIDDLHEVYQTAMGMEREALEQYIAWARETDEPHAAELFEHLISQERGHLTLLAEGQKLLDDPESWHFEQEQWIVEG